MSGFRYQRGHYFMKQVTVGPLVDHKLSQNLGRINRRAALELIERSADDPHPHIRSAARKTLSKLRPKPAP